MKELVKNIIYWSFVFCFRCLYTFFLLFPINPKKIFINCFDGAGVNDSPKYIYIKLRKIDPKIQFVFILNSKKQTQKNTRLEKFVNFNSIRSLYEMATAKIWISTVRMPLYAKKRKNQVYFQTWHGCIALKKIEKDTQNTLSTRYVAQAKYDSSQINFFISNSKFATDLFENSFWYKGSILDMGSPRMDPLVNCNKVSDVIKKRIGIPKGKKLLLYAPTFRNRDSFSHYSLDFERLRRVLEQTFGEEWVIGVRLHPRLSKLATRKFSFSRKFINLSEFPDVQQLMLGTDALITDYSSIMFDFMQTTRPVWIFADDIENYRKERSFYFQFDELPFELATDQQTLEKKITQYDENIFKKREHGFEKKMQIKNDGRSAERVALFIYQTMKGSGYVENFN